MKEIIKILNKAIIKEYYRKNVLFILAILALAFGILRAIEHITIIKLVLKSKPLMLWVFVLWALHSLKTNLFVLRIFESKSYEFLYQIRLFSFWKRFFSLFALHFQLNLLTFLYSLWMIKIGTEENKFQEIFIIILFQAVIFLFSALITEYRILNPNPNKIISSSVGSIFTKFRTTYPFFFIRHLLHKQPVMLLLSKFFSGFMLLGVCLLYPTDEYDERLLAIGGLFAALGQMAISYEFQAFEHKFLSFHKNLPISFSRRFLNFILIFSLILIPEIIILSRNLPEKVSFFVVFPLLFYILTISYLFFQFLFFPITDKDKFGRQIFFLNILYFLLIMFKIPIVLIGIINFLVSIYVFHRQYYLSEYRVEP